MNDRGPIVEKRFEYRGFPCVVLFQRRGWRCGYVGINHQIDFSFTRYSEIECHGGITYDDTALYGQDDKKITWIGFDCTHAFDLRDVESAEKYGINFREIMIMMELNKCYANVTHAHLWTLEDVENECKKIVDQIIEVTDGKHG